MKRVPKTNSELFAIGARQNLSIATLKDPRDLMRIAKRL